jgi:toxin ParE1/3/4
VKPLVYHKQAVTELDATAEYYESQHAALGLEFLEEVSAALHLIQQVPQAFSLYKKTAYRRCLVKRFPFSIFYLERDDDIWIAAIAHTRRHPDYWRRRKPG